MLYLLFLLKWLCSIQKVYFDVKKATFFLSATVGSFFGVKNIFLFGTENGESDKKASCSTNKLQK